MKKDILIGLEKETLYFKDDFTPRYFKQDELRKNMWLDFSTNQVEVISDPLPSVEKLAEQMYSVLNDTILTESQMWPLSQPGISDYEVKHDGLNSSDEIEYRNYLVSKYDVNLMNLSGIHFNYSITNASEEFYLDLMKKIYYYGPILLQFVSYTPVYQEGILDKNLEIIGKNKGFKNSLSLRNSYEYGYYNENELELNFNSVKEYKQSVESEINNGKIISKKELYSKVRLKETEIGAYIELRFIDINPFNRLGITSEMLKFITLFLHQLESLEAKNFDYKTTIDNFEIVSLHGLDKSKKLKFGQKEITLKEATTMLLTSMKENTDFDKEDIHIIDELLKDYLQDNLDVNKFIEQLDKENLTINEYGKKYSYTKEKFVPLYPDLKLELSTKILMDMAEKQKFNIEVLDEYENVIEVSNETNKELVVQATKTNKDSYANVLMLENKVMTKKILEKNGINVPRGFIYNRGDSIDLDFFKNNSVVVKPINTNFGQGITILQKDSTSDQIINALELALSFEERIICETYFTGVEYRFLVIDGELISVVNRKAANVIGDGIHTISELVEIKNTSPLRGTGYHTPLEKLKIGEFEIEFLKQQNLQPSSIISKNEVVYLRKNSNISTGGDSFEVIDIIPQKIKDIAIKATRVMNAKICGVDMIIDKNFEEYTIIETNFNPAIQMHTYPYNGIGINPANSILKLLFKK